MKIEYKNQTVEMPVKFTSLIDEKKVLELSNMFNQQIADGWELVAHSYLGNQGLKTNVLYITFKTSDESIPTIEYKSEIMEMKTKVFGSSTNENESKFNGMFNQQISEGWELVTHTFLNTAEGAQPEVMFVTFKKAR